MGNFKISIFGVGKCKISNFGLWRSTRVVFQLHLSVTLPFQAFLLVLIGFLYKTAQNPLKNRSNLALKPFKNHRKKWAVFEWFLSKIWAVWAVFFSKKTPKPLKSCRKTAQTADILSSFWAGSRPGEQRCQMTSVKSRLWLLMFYVLKGQHREIIIKCTSFEGLKSVFKWCAFAICCSGASVCV